MAHGEDTGLNQYNDVFEQLTEKQRQVLHLIAENRTSKEIAWELGVSESAINQRLEGVRARTGNPPRGELARAFRQFALAQDQREADETCKEIPDKITQVPDLPLLDQQSARDEMEFDLRLADALHFEMAQPRQKDQSIHVVPGVLDGAHPGLNRSVAIVALACGMLAVVMIGLGVAQALTTIF